MKKNKKHYFADKKNITLLIKKKLKALE